MIVGTYYHNLCSHETITTAASGNVSKSFAKNLHRPLIQRETFEITIAFCYENFPGTYTVGVVSPKIQNVVTKE